MSATVEVKWEIWDEIAFGRRRREACRQLGIAVRARVQALSDEELLRVMVRENTERAALSLYERGVFVRRLAEGENLSVRRLAELLGISPAYVSRLMRLPVLPPELEEMIGDPRALSMRLLEKLGALLGKADAIDRIVVGWGAIRPGATPERRARQLIELASGELSIHSSEDGREAVREIRTSDGRLIGEVRRGRTGCWLVELSSELSSEEIERVLRGASTALTAGV
jgi:hypothetical protein